MSYYDMPPSPASSASSLSSGSPHTPGSPSRAHSDYQTSFAVPSLPDYSDAFSQKSQISTAERRASHNAVERARRETLNARFLDLAALLPNLKHLRRPSKSTIVNSSIAHVRAARRTRALAAHQLRALNAECDKLRREVNYWRARAGMRAEPSPLRDAAFASVLSGAEPAFDPLDLDAVDEEDEEDGLARGRGRARRRMPGPPPEAACEGPLVLSHPYAQLHDSAPQPPPPPPPPVAAPLEVPGPGSGTPYVFDAETWAFAAAAAAHTQPAGW
ncbi:hypothetical protein GGX14DRAFT_659529 [Mycena pura]|uniref:BHLH domain-containing protein n=1 Tax=Mycena pura TaxID=153505 RepID=A0AAD6V4S9_9AGAR|nr:hypothetical protein GGX14DRAFT_659529 [Mycena pura]